MPWGFFGGKMLEKRPTWAQRITEARGKKGISQRELVKKMGCNQTSLVHYETGKIEPRIGFLINFIKETGVDHDITDKVFCFVNLILFLISDFVLRFY
jgi:transcriptional regulator with XRE-family HTH domain